MALTVCTGCGKQISDVAPSCIHCGMPRGGFTGPAVAAPARGGMEAWMIVLIVVGGGFALVVVLGIMAAIAIPRFASVSKQAKEAEAAPYLRQLVTLQNAYHDRTGVYTSDLSRLEGWESPTLMYYDLAVSQASDSRLCVDATPKPAFASQRLESQSIDQDGWLYGAAGCVEPDDEAAADSAGAAPSAAAGDSAGSEPVADEAVPTEGSLPTIERVPGQPAPEATGKPAKG